MPTLFGRRYMRDKVPTTEVVIGGGVLLLLAGIVVAAAVVGRHPQPGLFSVRPGSERPAAVGREVRVARQMLPGLGTAGWQLKGTPQILERADFEAAGEREWLAAGAAHVYRGEYASNATGESVTVQIVDAETPANAFGAYQTRRVEGAEPLAVGNAGWKTAQRGAFWAGRYYTEFDRSNVRGDAPSVMTIADALGSVQIAYGTPFWADGVLPPEGRVADSFSFVKRQAGGFAFLDEAFMAAYPKDVTGFVTDRGTTARAAELVKQFEGFLREQGRVQASPAQPEGELLAGDFADRQLAVFQVGGFVYGAVGRDMEPVSALVQQMLKTVRPHGESAAPAAAAGEKASPFPTVEVAGWDAPTQFREYTPLDLWEKIDGRADIYLQFGVQKMTFGSYLCRTDPGISIDVYWYEMAKPEGAFGIYQAESDSHATPIAVGDAGYGGGGSVIFRKGAHYIRVEANGAGAAVEAAGPAVAQAIAGRIAGGGGGVWAESVLPREGRTGEGIAFHGEDAFSLDFLDAVFSADYSVDGKSYTAFVHQAESAAAAVALLDQYEAFFKANGRVLERGRVDGVELLVGESGGLVDAAFAAGVYLGGVNNTADAALAKEKALSFAGAVKGR
jgi:hypothetical protein